MALFSQFQYGDGVLYGALSPVLEFRAEVNIQAGGARHGSINVSWDINDLIITAGVSGLLVVARSLSPATVPEEGEVMFQSWEAQSHATGDAVYYVQSGTWTYFSLFVMGADRRWRWVAYRLAMPVSDWEYGQLLPRMLPGAMTTNDQVVASPPSEGNLLAELLGEFGFVLDEVKTYAEALVPFWSADNMVPQSAPALAGLQGIAYYGELGPEVYRNLMRIKSEDSSTDVLAQKTAAVTRWRSRVRTSVNNILNVNDSSGELRPGLWAAETFSTVTNKSLTSNVATLTTGASHGLTAGNIFLVEGVGAPFDGRWSVASAPTTTTITFAVTAPNVTSAASSGTVVELGSSRELHLPGTAPEGMTLNDVQRDAYQRFSGGTWICGHPDHTDVHNINVNFWPTAIAGFYLRVNTGTDVDVTLSLDTRSSLDDVTVTNVPLLELTGLSTEGGGGDFGPDFEDEFDFDSPSEGGWIWYQSDVVALNTDVIGRPRLEISPSDAVVDLDVIMVGPAPHGYRAVPSLEAMIVPGTRYDEDTLQYDESIPYESLVVALRVLGPPEFSSARIDWGDGTATDDVTWDIFSSTLQTHDYTSKIVQDEEQRFFITVKDLSDPLIAASTSIVIGEVI